MPAINMGGTVASNPTLGKQVLMSPFSGPKGSPFDAKKAVFYDNLPGGNAWTAPVADTANLSTGGLSTGIGFGLNSKVGVLTIPPNFNDDYTPGVTKVTSAGLAASTIAELTAIGGGKCLAPSEAAGTTGIAVPDPYVAQPLLGFGGGGSRDAGAGPAFTGFATKMVTATGAVAIGAAIETGFLNRASGAMVSGQSEFGSATAASPAVT
jgi:hypothetical protein